MEAWLHSERWLPPHLSLSEVKLALLTVLLFLPTVVVTHKIAVAILSAVQKKKKNDNSSSTEPAAHPGASDKKKA